MFFFLRKLIRQYFSNITSKGIKTTKNFWKVKKSFLKNKGSRGNSDINLAGDEKIITDEKQFAQLFNDHYTNIVERSGGIKPEKVKFDIESRLKFYSR